MPRTRRGCRSQLLARYQRRQESVHELVREAFLRGISTRQVGEVLEPILGEACPRDINITRASGEVKKELLFRKF